MLSSLFLEALSDQSRRRRDELCLTGYLLQGWHDTLFFELCPGKSTLFQSHSHERKVATEKEFLDKCIYAGF